MLLHWVPLLFIGPAAAQSPPTLELAAPLKGAASYILAPHGLAQPSLNPTRTGGNVIYYLFLPSAQKAFGATRLGNIVNAGNVMLTSLGVKTRMAGLMLGDEFDRSLLDRRDRVCLLGSKSEIMPILVKMSPDSAYAEQDWHPEGSNPELSRHDDWTIVDVGAVKKFSADTRGLVKPEEVAALFAIHGTGHQVWIGHPNKGNFMDDGSRLMAYLSGRKDLVDENMNLVDFGKPQSLRGLFRAEDFAMFPAPSARANSRSKATQLSLWTKVFGTEEPMLGYAFKAALKTTPHQR